jgi:hypothetical protein
MRHRNELGFRSFRIFVSFMGGRKSVRQFAAKQNRLAKTNSARLAKPVTTEKKQAVAEVLPYTAALPLGFDFSGIPVYRNSVPASAPEVRLVAFSSPLPQRLQRKCACGAETGFAGECTECQSDPHTRIRRRGSRQDQSASAPPIVYDVLRSSGQPLDAAARTYLEPRFGCDFSRVRVHADAKAAESARAVNALAYTVGPNIVFGVGRYAPATKDGIRLIAHELTHVRQQRNCTNGSLLFDRNESNYEQEANEVSRTLSSSLGEHKGPAGRADHYPLPASQVPALSFPHIQREKAGASDGEALFEDDSAFLEEEDEDAPKAHDLGDKKKSTKKKSKTARMRGKVRWDIFSGGGLPSLFGGEKAKYTHNRNWRFFRPHGPEKRHTTNLKDPPCKPSVLNISFQWKPDKADPVDQTAMDAQIANVVAHWQPCNKSVQIVINSPARSSGLPPWFVEVMKNRASIIQAALIAGGIPADAFLPSIFHYDQPVTQNAQVRMK